MPLDRIEDGIVVQGGTLDGRTLPLFKDPFDPPGTLIHQDGSGMQEIYTPRARTAADDGPLWVYVYLRTEPAPTA
ncbi:hypothetical protein ACIOC2_01390 [Streptomyces sp. NPDC088337]|uniref:hypothetical protein n=1 Tax=unclassified Streptomyces TaxID=2593676 RepID=UPI00380E1074